MPFPADATGADANTILAIDDDPIALELLRRILTREGYRFETASNGIDGLRLARQTRPGAVILDVSMPGMDGWAVLDAFKQDPELANVPVIMATMVDERTRGFASGATDYFLKPVDRTRLVSIVKACVKAIDPVKPAPEAAADPLPGPGAAPVRVLVVEDDRANREVLCRLARKEGWLVSEADNGLAALAAVAQNPPDLILLDLTLPELDGFGVLRELRLRGADRIPVVAISARDLTRDERKLLNGVRRVFLKGSYNRNELLREVRSHLTDRLIPPNTILAN